MSNLEETILEKCGISNEICEVTKSCDEKNIFVASLNDVSCNYIMGLRLKYESIQNDANTDTTTTND